MIIQEGRLRKKGGAVMDVLEMDKDTEREREMGSYFRLYMNKLRHYLVFFSFSL